MKGFILGIKKEIAVNCSIRKSTNEYCIVELKEPTRIISILFLYLSPSSLTSLNSILINIDMHSHLIIMGDLNARIGNYNPDHSVYYRNSKDSVINSRGKALIDIINLHSLSILNGCSQLDINGEFTFVNKNGSSSIHLCLINNSFQTDNLDFQVLDYESSCHFPICLSVNPCQIRPYTYTRKKIVWEQHKSMQFRETLDATLSYHPNATIDFETLSHNIIQAIETTKMVKTHTITNEIVSAGPVWFDEKCRQYKLAMRRCLRIFRKCNSTSENYHAIRLNYVQSKRTYNNLLVAKKQRHYANLEARMINVKYPGDFFNALSNYRPKYQSSQCNNPTEPAAFAQYFSNQFSLYETPICQQSFDATNDQELDCEFCIDELEEAIRKLSVRKAPGSDGIPNEVWKSLSSEHKCYLLESFNSCWNNCNFPLEWSEIIISPIFKKGDRSNPDIIILKILNKFYYSSSNQYGRRSVRLGLSGKKLYRDFAIIVKHFFKVK
jgi:hypothetical protein